MIWHGVGLTTVLYACFVVAVRHCYVYVHKNYRRHIIWILSVPPVSPGTARERISLAS